MEGQSIIYTFSKVTESSKSYSLFDKFATHEPRKYYRSTISKKIRMETQGMTEADIYGGHQAKNYDCVCSGEEADMKHFSSGLYCQDGAVERGAEYGG